MSATYKVFERVGAGGMATVHRAERLLGGVRQAVALKRLLPHASHDPELVRLFLDEARLVSTLRHRNIAEIYEVGQLDDDYFLAMEYVAGPTLHQLLRSSYATGASIPFPIVLKLLVQVCDALAYAHDKRDESGKPLGLVHRDITPSNIVISSNGVVKLIDFGIAKTSMTHTQTGVIKGKLGYIAPEYLVGSIDRRADLWAVGVVAWELLTNRRLFKADDDLKALEMLRSQPIDPPSMHNPDVPPELDAIVMTALHRDPASRWQNAAAMRTALLGVAPASNNGELVEWVQWVLALDQRGVRPPRGSRPLRVMKAAYFVLPGAAPLVPMPVIAMPPLPRPLMPPPVFPDPVASPQATMPTLPVRTRAAAWLAVPFATIAALASYAVVASHFL